MQPGKLATGSLWYSNGLMAIVWAECTLRHTVYSWCHRFCGLAKGVCEGDCECGNHFCTGRQSDGV